MNHPQLARIVKRCQDLPGHELFQYIAEDGQRHCIGSADVNDYLRGVTGHEFTAKDFRTWAGTVLAATALAKCQPCGTKLQITKNIRLAIETVARKLGNTATVCRKCYVHPHIIESYIQGTLVKIFTGISPHPDSSRRNGLTRHDVTLARGLRTLSQLPPREAAILKMLRSR